MNMKRWLVIFSGSIVALIAASTGVAFADHTTRVVEGVQNSSIYEAASNVTINGTINGDVFCAGQMITINATVNGDVLCAGQDITVNGRVNGSVRLAGQVVNLNGRVMRSASIATQDFTMNNGSSVGIDLSLVGQDASIDAPVGRDVNGTVQSVSFSSAVGRNVTLHANTIALNHGTVIVGDLTYTSPHTVQRADGTFIRGAVTYHKASPHNTSLNTGVFIWAELFWLVALIVFCAVIVALFPQQFRAWNVEWGAPFWWAVLVGFIAMFAVPLIVILLALTLIGIPLAIVLGLLWIVEAFLAVPFSAYFVGSLIVTKRHPIWLVIVGIIILGIIELIPILGWIIGAIAYWLGSGTLIMGLNRRYGRPTYHEQ
jgi:cytoskeletal protein CcmA (bactofilin family)